MSAQKRSEPSCPAQNAVNLYTLGRFELVYEATKRNEKSDVSSAVHNPMDASTTNAHIANSARRALAMSSVRCVYAPANPAVVPQAATSNATQSDNSPMRITFGPRLPHPSDSRAWHGTSRARSHIAMRTWQGPSS